MITIKCANRKDLQQLTEQRLFNLDTLNVVIDPSMPPGTIVVIDGWEKFMGAELHPDLSPSIPNHAQPDASIAHDAQKVPGT